MERLKMLILVVLPVLLIGCSGTAAWTNATNPIEKGLVYVGSAIVIHGILQVCFRE